MTLLSPNQFMFSSPPIIAQSRRYRKQKPSMRLIPNMLAKPATTVPKRLFKKLRSYVIPKSAYDMPSSPTTPGKFFRNRRYVEKRLYGDSCDYYTDSDDEDGDEDGYIIVPDKRQSRRCVSGEKRAGVGAWEIDSRSMMV